MTITMIFHRAPNTQHPTSIAITIIIIIIVQHPSPSA
jgi:hypothetical protein